MVAVFGVVVGKALDLHNRMLQVYRMHIVSYLICHHTGITLLDIGFPLISAMGRYSDGEVGT